MATTAHEYATARGGVRPEVLAVIDASPAAPWSLATAHVWLDEHPDETSCWHCLDCDQACQSHNPCDCCDADAAAFDAEG
jgi:hypothetical protein